MSSYLSKRVAVRTTALIIILSLVFGTILIYNNWKEQSEKAAIDLLIMMLVRHGNGFDIMRDNSVGDDFELPAMQSITLIHWYSLIWHGRYSYVVCGKTFEPFIIMVAISNDKNWFWIHRIGIDKALRQVGDREGKLVAV